MKTLSAEEFLAMKDQGTDFVLVNTLDEEQFPETEIGGAINAPQSGHDFVQRVEEEAGDRERKIVVYCASHECQSSYYGGQKLERAGFTNVYDLPGGYEEWRKVTTGARARS